LNNQQGHADALNALGIIHQRMRRFQEAADAYQKSIDIKKQIGDRRGIAASLQNMANLFSLQGLYGDAEKRNQEALAIFQELNNEQGISNILFNLGHIYQDTGRFDDALTHFRRALTIASRLGNVAFLADLGERIGQIYYLLGQYADAITYHKQALAEREKINDEEGKLRSYQSLGDLDVEQGRYEEALERHRAALTLGRKLGFAEAAAVSKSQMAWIYQLTGRYRAALDSYAEVHAEFEKLKIAARIAEMEKRLGSLHLEIGDLARSREYLGKALGRAASINDPGLIGQIAVLQGDAAFAEGKTQAAREAYQRAQSLAAKSRSARDLLTSEVRLAKLESRQGNPKRGSEMLRARLSRAEEIVQADAIAQCYLELVAAPGENLSQAQIHRWHDRLREFGQKRYRLEFARAAAARAERAGRSKEAESFRREAEALLTEIGAGLEPAQQTALRQALQ
jgi:tetratricopeptide (TPR) repeat protein